MSLISEARLIRNINHNTKVKELAEKQGEVGLSAREINGEKWYSY